jgi:hypothetical protein
VTSIEILPEPLLEFRYRQQMADPKAGLGLFGAFDIDAKTWPGRIPYAVVGTPRGIAAFERFGECLADPVISEMHLKEGRDATSRLLWPAYPGFEVAFGESWAPGAAWSRAIDESKLRRAAQHNDKFRRAYDTTNLYLREIRTASERDEKFGVVVCVIPDEVWENCRPLSHVSDGEGVALSKRERDMARQQIDLLNPYYPEEYDLSVDFRRQLKARAMEYRLPIQLVRESTLVPRDTSNDDDRGLTPLSDRAWNLSTAIYYKSGGKPWRLASARDGVCYIGLAFRQSELDDDSRTACCAAQMFLDTGDGVVFQGEFGPWYSEEENACHLDESAAERLLRGVLHEYGKLDGRPLKEVFLHSRSTISVNEWEGYRRACPQGVKLVGVRVRRDRDGMRLYRGGDWPALRGTLWRVSDRFGYLWASGFKPSLLSYDGWEVPVPLRIDIEHGEADIGQVARDILGLTKLNYNSCKLGDASPVTVGFSDQVGEILIGNPKIKVRLPAFRYYI